MAKSRRTSDEVVAARYVIRGGFLNGYHVVDTREDNAIVSDTGLGMWEAIAIRDELSSR